MDVKIRNKVFPGWAVNSGKLKMESTLKKLSRSLQIHYVHLLSLEIPIKQLRLEANDPIPFVA